MKKHILSEKAYIYKLTRNKIKMQNYLYDDIKGFWITKEGIPCMEYDNFPKPTTKKCDIETGEDQKGE